MSTNYLTAPNDSSFWDTFDSSIDKILGVYKEVSKVEMDKKLGNVLTDPNTNAGEIYTTNVAFSSAPAYSNYILLALIAFIAYLILR